MPGLERITDMLRLDLAETPEDKAYVRGFIAGKSKARKEALCMSIFYIALGAVIFAGACL